eukprot:3589147-Pyramimonas_sp.AAC.1
MEHVIATDDVWMPEHVPQESEFAVNAVQVFSNYVDRLVVHLEDNFLRLAPTGKQYVVTAPCVTTM